MKTKKDKIKELKNSIQKRAIIVYGIILIVYTFNTILLLPNTSAYNTVSIIGFITIIMGGFGEIISHTFKKINSCFSSGTYNNYFFMTGVGINTIVGLILLVPGILFFERNMILLSIIFGLFAVVLFLLPLFNSIIINKQIEYGTEKIRIVINTDERKYFDIKEIEYLVFKGEDKNIILKQKLKEHLEECDKYAQSLDDYSHSYMILAGGDSNG